MTRTVLVDLTPLDTPTRVRGIGRYVREVATSLAKHAASEPSLRLVGLTHLAWDGSYRTTDDLASFEGSPELAQPTSRDHYRWAYARRFGLARALRRIRPDAVHLVHPEATPLGMALTRAKRIVTCHDVIALHYPERYYSVKDGGRLVGAMIERRRYRTADRVIAISDATRDDLVGLLGVDPARITRVYSGVDLDRWRRLSSAPGVDDVLARHGLAGERFLIYVGDADFRKNAEGMLRGLALARAAGHDLVLAWAGKLSPERTNEVRDIAREAGVSGALHLLGFVDDADLARLYRAAAAHLFVSRIEGFGLTVVEAMASGCPVVTTRGGSLGEVAGDAALVVDPEDERAIADAIGRVASERALADDLVRRGAARAALFSLEALGRSTLAVYREVVGA